MNFAIIGCGFIAKKHAEAINNNEKSRLVAVCDKNEDAMIYYQKQYGASMYRELNKLLLEENIDVVCICTPSGFHSEIAVQVANAKKHIIVEKPIAMTIEDTQKIISAVKDNSVKLAVVHPNRFRPAVQQLKKILDDGMLGKISHVSCVVNWNRNQEYYDQAPWRGTKDLDGGVLMNQAIHNLDLLLWFMGKPKQVFSMEATRLRNIEAEDVSMGIVQFESGVLGSIETSTTVYPKNFEESITIFGERGTIKIGGPNALYFQHLEVKEMSVEEIENTKNNVLIDPLGVPGHQRIIDDMIDAIEQDRVPSITGEDGLNVLNLVLSMYESAKKNKPVHFN